MGVMVEYEIDEAEATLKRLAQDGTGSMTGAECDAVEQGRIRLETAVQVERGPGGAYHNPDQTAMDAVAQGLIGQRIRVSTTYGKTFTGTLARLGGFRSLIIEDGRFTHPINLSLVETLEAERAAA